MTGSFWSTTVKKYGPDNNSIHEVTMTNNVSGAKVVVQRSRKHDATVECKRQLAEEIISGMHSRRERVETDVNGFASGNLRSFIRPTSSVSISAASSASSSRPSFMMGDSRAPVRSYQDLPKAPDAPKKKIPTMSRVASNYAYHDEDDEEVDEDVVQSTLSSPYASRSTSRADTYTIKEAIAPKKEKLIYLCLIDSDCDIPTDYTDDTKYIVYESASRLSPNIIYGESVVIVTDESLYGIAAKMIADCKSYADSGIFEHVSLVSSCTWFKSVLHIYQEEFKKTGCAVTLQTQ
jgi:hypothetical protein